MIEEYRKAEGLSYSLLSKLDRDPAKVYKDDYSDYLKLGSVVDALLTSKEEYEKRFIINFNYDKPSDNIKEILNSLDLDKSTDIKDFKSEILKAAEVLEYGKNWKEETILSKVYHYQPYFKFLHQSRGKEIIEFEEYSKVNLLVNNLKSSPFTGKYFVETKNVKCYDQFPIYFEYKGRKYKVLIDKLFVNDETKKVLPVDIKTMGEGLYKFNHSFRKWRYDLQSSLYKHGVEAEFPTYEVKDFKFVVGSFSDARVQVFNAKNYYEKARDGYIDKLGNPVKGWLQLSEEYEWHTANSSWDYPKEVYDNNGEVIID